MIQKIFILLMLIMAAVSGTQALAQSADGQSEGLGPQSSAATEPVETPAAGTVSDLPPLTGAPQAGPSDLSNLGSGLPISSSDIIWNIGIFLLVLAFLFLVLKALGRVSRFKGRSKGGPGFVIKAIQPLDNKKYLAAVELEGRTIVVGVSVDRITPVAQWLNDEEESGLDLASAKYPDQASDLDLKLPEDDTPTFDLGLRELKPPKKTVVRPKTTVGSYTFENSKDKT